MEKMSNEGNQIHNFVSSSGSGTDLLTSYGSGSTGQKVPVPIPQRLLQNGKRKDLKFT
jgi:hypothetical protein